MTPFYWKHTNITLNNRINKSHSIKQITISNS
jgi:hypothetical protein